jgi:hypothetical protein
MPLFLRTRLDRRHLGLRVPTALAAGAAVLGNCHGLQFASVSRLP